MKRTKTKKLTLAHVVPLPEVGEEFTFVSGSVSNRQEGLFLFIKNDLINEIHGRYERKGGPSFPKRKMANAKTMLVVILSDENRQDILIDDVDFTFPEFDLFPDGRILLAAGWCANDDLNGLIFNSETREKTKFHAGDGIETICIDDASRIFISYFDEGIFGDGPGMGGITCFNDEGGIIWQFNSTDRKDAYISDCYAMNVTGFDAYIYYYTDFELAKIGPKFETAIWKTDISGCHCFAISDDALLFSSQYGEPENSFHLMKRLPRGLSNKTPVEVKLDIGTFDKQGQTIGRGASIHHINKQGWFRGSIDTLLE